MGAPGRAGRGEPGGWEALLSEPPPARRLLGERHVPWAVIGAGFTGLAAARRLSELVPHERGVVLEAERVGSGPSGRSSGFVIAQPHNVDVDVEDDEANRRILRLGEVAVAELRGLVERHGIACGWSEAGKLHAAAGDRGARLVDALARGLERLGEPFETVDRGRLAERIGSRHYTRALWTRCVLVQPAALVRGLAGALPANVELHEESPVRSVERTRSGWRLVTAHGVVQAVRVILATDAFTRRLGFLRSRLIPVLTFASLTRPVEGLSGDPEWGILPAHKAGATLRRLRDGRLLVRSAFRYGGELGASAAQLERARRHHAEALRVRFPGLRSLALETTWGGVVCFTRNFAPFFGRLAEGLHAAVGTNGVGIAKGTIAGRLVAELSQGVGSPLLDDLLALPRPAWVPPEPLLGLAVRARLAWEQRAAGAER